MPVSKNRKTEKSLGDLELLDVLKSRPYDLLIPSDTLKKQSLDSIKKSLDPIASHYSIFDEVHLEGLDVEQVWAQAQMIVEGVLDKVVTEEVPQLIESGVVKPSSFKSDMIESEEEDDDEDDDDKEANNQEIDENSESEDAFNSNEEGEEDDEVDEVDDDEEDNGLVSKGKNASLGDEDSDFDVDMDHDDYQESDMELKSDEEEEEGEDNDDNKEDNEEEEEEEYDDDDDESNEAAKELNDDFFKLDAFQKQIEALEKDNEDEDEDIDYFADLSSKNNGKEEDDGMDALKYEDFFAPPKKKRAFNDKNRKRPDTKKEGKKPSPLKEEEFLGFDLDADENEYEKAMGSIRKDLFEEDDDSEDNGDKKKEILSTLEKQQRDIEKQIEQFEQENVGSKPWVLSGEAKAKDRPANSLLEADLDFERSRKPAPVITQEVTDTLEDLIKMRIKKNDFNDIPRRLPDTIPEFRPRKLADVQETKSKKSLGELYEEDYLKQTDPDAYAAQQNEQLDAVHQEIVNMFTSLSRKLDSLSAWHYTPKEPTPSISIVAEAPAISMEDAQPTALSTDATLAPQEVFKASEAKMNNLEVIGRNGLPISRSEMSREDKKRLRRKIKERKSKAFKEKEEKQKSLAQKKGSKADVMETLKKANVTVIDKKGQKRDLSGKLKDTGKGIKPTELRL